MLKTKQKGARAEHRARRILEAAGYLVTRAGGSLGAFDLIAIGAQDVRCIQVKSGGSYLSGLEREVLHGLRVPPLVSREVWRFPDYCRQPLIEVL